jgi:hypothetical protein
VERADREIWMKPMVVWGQQATQWTRVSRDWLEKWRDRADLRLDPVARVSLRKWLASVAAAAVAVGVAAVMLHVLLLEALRSGTGTGWLAVGTVASVAVVLLVIVLRDTLVALVALQRRRAHLLGLLLSAAAVLASVEACAGVTAAMPDHTVGLWPAEQLFAWHLLDSVPLLAVPQRLGWDQPVVAASAGDHAILVAFTVALIVPLIRIVIALYHLTGGHAAAQPGGAARAGQSRWSSVTLAPGIRLPGFGIAICLAVAACFVWGGLGDGTALGGRIVALSDVAYAVVVTAAVLGAILLAALLAAVMGVVRVLWEPVSGGPWTQLALAAGLVWLDNPVRQALLPSVGGYSVFWKIVVMLGLWAVLTVLLLPVWVDPQLPETLLALALLLGFAGAGAPGSQRLAAAFGATPGGFAIGPAVATALAGLTAAYLAYLVSRAPARAANAGRLHLAGWVDLRHELAGFAYIGLQVTMAAAGVLMVLNHLGVVSASQAADAPRALAAVAWHVADSTGLPGLAGWRLATDFTGPWAGAVVVAAVAALVVVMVFPMVRATLRWAKLQAGNPALDRPLAEVPAALLRDLDVVRAFLTESWRIADHPSTLDTETRDLIADLYQAEERLAAAELDRPKLRELLGEDSPVYRAADNAVSGAIDACRTVVRTRLRHPSPRWSPWPARTITAADAVAAIDVYAAAVERWQMGEDVVAEIESRVFDLDSREHDMRVREGEATTREHGLAARERGVEVREQALALRESATLTREQDIESREHNAEMRERTAEVREHSVEVRESVVETRERSAATREEQTDVRERAVQEREQSIDTREQTAATREEGVQTRERQAAVRESEVDAREEWLQAREQNAEAREAGIVARERAAAAAPNEPETEASEQAQGPAEKP